MKLSSESLSDIYSEHLWLKLSDTDLKEAESKLQNYSNETACNYAYINRLCLNTFLKWIQKNLGVETSLSVFHNEKIWEFVNGCSINFGSKRLVLIPSDIIDIADFAIPQEWVDIPNWAADYYLPVQIDLEEQYLHFWGFVSRRTLMAKADYDPIYRLYYVEGDCVIPNLECLGVGLSFFPDEKGEVATLPKLLETEAHQLIAQLSKPSPYSPRLKAKFEKWGALLNDSHCLENLYKRRVQLISFPSTTGILNRWLDGVVEAGWQTFEELFDGKTIAPVFRGKRLRGIELETPEKVKRAVRQLYNTQSEVAFPPNIEEKDALVHLLKNTQNENIRWKAAEYLWTIDPNHPGSAVRRVMDLGIKLMGHSIALMVAVLGKLDGQVAVLLRTYSIGSKTTLPPGLRLIGLDENGIPILGLEAVARSEPQDDYIALCFTADVGDYFSVQITLENVSFTENFIA